MAKLTVRTPPARPPGRRGPKPGSTPRRLHETICPAPDCPRAGAIFLATAKRIYCSAPCQARARTARKKASP